MMRVFRGAWAALSLQERGVLAMGGLLLCVFIMYVGMILGILLSAGR